MDVPLWDKLSWGEHAKRLYADLKELPEANVKKATHMCYSDYSQEKCDECPLRQYGCSDRIDVEVWRRLKQLRMNEKAKAILKDFEVCFSDGLPERCRKCGYDYHKEAGCKGKMLRDAWQIIDTEKYAGGKIK